MLTAESLRGKVDNALFSIRHDLSAAQKGLSTDFREFTNPKNLNRVFRLLGAGALALAQHAASTPPNLYKETTVVPPQTAKVDVGSPRPGSGVIEPVFHPQTLPRVPFRARQPDGSLGPVTAEPTIDQLASTPLKLVIGCMKPLGAPDPVGGTAEIATRVQQANDYLKTVSNGMFYLGDVSICPDEWLESQYPSSYYFNRANGFGRNGSPGSLDAISEYMLARAWGPNAVDFIDYAGPDGYLPVVMVVWDDTDPSYSPSGRGPWPTFFDGGIGWGTEDNAFANKWIIAPLMADSSGNYMLPLGEFMHELMHRLGLKDLYGSAKSFGNVGIFFVNGSGEWGVGPDENGIPRQGMGPTSPDPWKRPAPWTDPIPINLALPGQEGQTVNLRPWKESGDYLLLQLPNGEQIIAVLITDTAAPNPGLVFLRVDPSKGPGMPAIDTSKPLCNQTNHAAVTVVSPDPGKILAQGGAPNFSTYMFPGKSGETALTPGEKDASIGQDGPGCPGTVQVKSLQINRDSFGQILNASFNVEPWKAPTYFYYFPFSGRSIPGY